MSAVVIQNSRAGADGPPESPVHDDGTRYPYSMRFDGGDSLAFGDTPVELLSLLIHDYDSMEPAEQQVARIKFAIRVQTTSQARLNHEVDGAYDTLTATELDVLNGPRFEQPHGWGTGEMGDVWEPEHVPLVLVETGYAPYTDIDKPISAIADVENPPNIIWLRPVEEWEFLVSLANVGFIDLFEATDL